jgi:amino acid adenylation domain-containing protein
LFDEELIQQALTVYRRVLQEMTNRPDAVCGSCCCAPPEDLELITRANQTIRTWNPAVNLCELIERQSRLTPGAPAVRFMGQPLTYAELNSRANRVARLLRREGLTKGDAVAVVLDRSLELVVTLIAVLKTGAAYVPLDAGHPPERNRKICEDSRVKFVITSPGVKVPPQTRAVYADLLERDSSAEPSGNLDTVIDPDSLCYIIYTSGSTGAPKGAMNAHRGVCNRLLWMQEQYVLTRKDRVLQKTPYTFDVSVWEFFWPLISGACLVVAAPGGHLDPEYLAETIRKESITTVHFVPAMLRSFLAETDGPFTSLRNVICSGEALDRELVYGWYSRSAAALHNLYGPAEAAIDVTAHFCDPAATGLVPIGKPIANTRIYVLDEDFQHLPAGVSGEIYIAGAGVGRGYTGDPSLTGERFIPDPFADQPGARMYRTADRGRWLRDGNIEFHGRSDNQIKIRGQRVELGEIEWALRQIVGVGDAAVLAAPDGKGSMRLLAWVVPKPDAELDTNGLRRELGERLPRYMVPSQLRIQQELPLNRNGKVDRRRLLDQATAAKDNRIEEILARVEMFDDLAIQELLAETV